MRRVRRRRGDRWRGDSGAATVLVLACVLAVGATGALWLRVADAGLSRQRAETAADLAALAGAAAARSLAADPCVAAAEIAERNGANLESCVTSGGEIAVSVEVSGVTSARAQARAGAPDEASPSHG